MRITAFEVFSSKHVVSIDTELTKKDMAMLSVLVATTMLVSPIQAMAASSDITEKVTKASQPIKDLLIGVADPVCYIVFTWGLLEAMLGKGASGLTRMKYAAIGYMGMNWLPVFMEIMRNAKP